MEGHRSTSARAHSSQQRTQTAQQRSELSLSQYLIYGIASLMYLFALNCFLVLRLQEEPFFQIIIFSNILTYLLFRKTKKLLSVLILSQTGIYRFKIYQCKIFTPVLKASQYHGLWIHEKTHLLSFIDPPSVCPSIII